jgi:hypothetical protein
MEAARPAAVAEVLAPEGGEGPRGGVTDAEVRGDDHRPSEAAPAIAQVAILARRKAEARIEAAELTEPPRGYREVVRGAERCVARVLVQPQVQVLDQQLVRLGVPVAREPVDRGATDERVRVLPAVLPQPRQPVGHHLAVVVEEHEPIPARDARAGVACRGGPAVRLPVAAHPQPIGEGRRHIAHRRTPAVVDHDHLEVVARVAQRRQRLQAVVHRRGPVARGGDHGDQCHGRAP